MSDWRTFRRAIEPDGKRGRFSRKDHVSFLLPLLGVFGCLKLFWVFEYGVCRGYDVVYAS